VGLRKEVSGVEEWLVFQKDNMLLGPSFRGGRWGFWSVILDGGEICVVKEQRWVGTEVIL